MTDELRAAIAADPDAIDNWIVYADWLMERDDPRGELIALSLADEVEPLTHNELLRLEALQRDCRARLSPALLDRMDHVELSWHRGFIVDARLVGEPTPAVLDALFADPHACTLRSLDVGAHVELCAHRSTNVVRELRVMPESSCELVLDAAFPKLEELAITIWTYGETELPVVERLEHRTLTAVSLDGPSTVLRDTRWVLPNLTTAAFGDVAELFGARGILRDPPPRLSSLMRVASADAVRALRESPLVAQLQKLVVQIDNAVLDEIERDPEPFRRIPQLTLMRDPLDEDYAGVPARARDLLPNAEVDFFEAYDEPQPAPDVLAPEVATGIGDAIARLVERMRQR